MEYYSLETVNEENQYELILSAPPIYNDLATSPPWMMKSTETALLHMDATLSYGKSFSHYDLASDMIPNLQDTSCDFEFQRDMREWVGRIPPPDSWSTNTDGAIVTPASFHAPAESSMWDFVDPITVFSPNPQDACFWPVMHQQQPGAATGTPIQSDEQVELEPQHLQLYDDCTLSSCMQSIDCLVPEPHVEEIIANIVDRICKSSDSPSEPPILPPTARETDDKVEKVRSFLASKDGKKLSREKRRQLRNRASAWTCRERKKEYASQIANDINSLRIQNRALTEKNERAIAFIRTILRHPAVTPFLEDFSRDDTANPNLSTTPADG